MRSTTAPPFIHLFLRSSPTGVKGLYDFGPPGSAMMVELERLWRDFFITEDDLLPITTSTLTPYEVFKYVHPPPDQVLRLPGQQVDHLQGFRTRG